MNVLTVAVVVRLSTFDPSNLEARLSILCEHVCRWNLRERSSRSSLETAFGSMDLSTANSAPLVTYLYIVLTLLPEMVSKVYHS